MLKLHQLKIDTYARVTRTSEPFLLGDIVYKCIKNQIVVIRDSRIYLAVEPPNIVDVEILPAGARVILEQP